MIDHRFPRGTHQTPGISAARPCPPWREAVSGGLTPYSRRQGPARSGLYPPTGNVPAVPLGRNTGTMPTMTDATVTVTRDDLDGGWIAEWRDIPGCMSQGDSREEAVAYLVGAVFEMIRVGVVDLDMLKQFRTNCPVRITHDEDGAPLTRATNIKASFYPDWEEDEIVLTDGD